MQPFAGFRATPIRTDLHDVQGMTDPWKCHLFLKEDPPKFIALSERLVDDGSEVVGTSWHQAR